MVGTFVLIYILQCMDKKFKNKSLKSNFFEMIKFPLLSAAIVGLSIEFFGSDNISYDSSPANIQEIFTEVPNF